jgi:broad specificity phosphatase PhoE
LVAGHILFIRVLACAVLDVGPATYRHFKLSNAHAVLVKFHGAPPHQLAGLNIPTGLNGGPTLGARDVARRPASTHPR